MPRVTFIEHDGTETEVEVPVGWTLMQGATLNGVDGIEGECGGSMSCATCHCYIEEGKVGRLPPMSDIENEMLEGTVAERKPNSRLGCQVKVTPELDGLIVRLPEAQS